jgi:hypothetical protein
MAVTNINIDSQVLTFANLAAFPLVGTVKTIYIAENTNFQYYWNGVAYELLTTLPTSGGGGASINYYLNGSINQGTISGVTYYEMNRTPILGLGTNFTLTNTNDYIASFLTDAGDPNQLNIPAGNWNCELYFNVSNNSGTPSFYIELYKYDGVTFTLIASSSTNPEFITNGTQVDLYTTAIPVPQTTLLATDRLAVRVHVNTSGNRTVTLHTEDNNLCQIITTFSTGLTALNGLIAQVQNFATGTSGTDFAINSVTDTHTFNLPTASAANRGALSSADWTIFNNKVPTGLITSSGLTMNTAHLLGRGTAGVGAVEEIVIGSGLTLTGTTLSAAGGSGITIGTTAIASGTVGRVLFEGAGNVVQQDSTFVWNNTDKRLILGTEAVASPNSRCVIIGKGTGTNQTFAVHNNTGTNNSLVVLDNGRIGLNTSTPSSIFNINGNAIASNVSNAVIRLSYLGVDYNDISFVSGSSGNNGMMLVGGSSDYRSPNIFIRSTNSTSSGNAGIVLGLNVYQGVVSTSIWDNPYKFSATSIFNQDGSSSYTLTLLNNNSGTTNNNTLSFWHLRSGGAAVNRVGEITTLQPTNTASFNGVMAFSTAISGTIGERMRISETGSLLVNTTTDVATSILTLASTTKGFLPPRMTTAQRDLIATPAEGLVIYNTTTQVLNFYNGAVWAAV